MAAAPGWPADPRFRVEHNIPWAFAWTGLIALPAAAVAADQLYFDESFRGWGNDDLEWGYRVCASGIPIVLRPDVYGLHLPHRRNAAANRRTGQANADRFLRKWPARDVELVRLVGDTRANGLWPDYRAAVAQASGAAAFGVAVGTVPGGTALVIGVPVDDADRPVERPLSVGLRRCCRGRQDSAADRDRAAVRGRGGGVVPGGRAHSAASGRRTGMRCWRRRSACRAASSWTRIPLWTGKSAWTTAARDRRG